MASNQDKGPPLGAQPSRIAVVFVHGQGEQTPMTDVMALADSVWRTDPAAAGGSEPAPVYSTPVYDQDESDQRRLVTQVVDGQQVDFYQFYWADLMEGNRITHLWLWFTALMRRSPDEVPKAIWPVRQAAMLIALVLGVWGVLFGALTAWRLAPGWIGEPAAWWMALVLAAMGWNSAQRAARTGSANRTRAEVEGRRQLLIALAGFGLAFAPIALLAREPDWSLLVGGGALALGGLAVAVLGLRDLPAPPANWEPSAQAAARRAWLSVAAGLVLALVGGLAAQMSLRGGQAPAARQIVAVALTALAAFAAPQLLFSSRRAEALGLGVALILGSLAACLIPGLAASLPIYRAAGLVTAVAALGLAGAGYWLSGSFLVPVMTDSARMFSNSPVNIPNQNRIRQRGMALMRQLHDEDGKRPYDRIIVLAHSLGTVVAYRLLAHYWGSILDELPRGAPQKVTAEVALTARALRAAPERDDQAMLEWRKAVRAYWAALNAPVRPAAKDKEEGPKPGRPWKISDFVTIGSPLTYAALLLEESDDDFLQEIKMYKRYPSCPPQPRAPYEALRADVPISPFDVKREPHHAALFAATCWTNLYFPPRGVAGGDVIGGPICAQPPHGLGLGVLDVDLGHDETVEGFAHNDYWKGQAGADLAVRPGSSGVAAPHVAALRDALRILVGAEEADRRLLKPAQSYPNPET